MPFKNKEKQKEYYHRTANAYNKKWIEKNRGYWNKYQADRKREKRNEELSTIINGVSDLNIYSIDEVEYRAAVILFVMLKMNICAPRFIAQRTGFDLSEIKEVHKNWIDNGILVNGIFHMEECNTPLEEVIQITLIALTGSGKIKRQERSKQ